MSNTYSIKTWSELGHSLLVLPRCFILVKNPLISHDWGKNWAVTTTNGAHSWLSVTQVFQVIMTTEQLSTWWLLLGLLSRFLVSSNTHQRIVIEITRFAMSHQLKYVFSICRCCWNVATIKWNCHNRNINIISFVLLLCNHLKNMYL